MEQLLKMSRKFAPHMPDSYHHEFVRQVIGIERASILKEDKLGHPAPPFMRQHECLQPVQHLPKGF
jgi:hypothetical protein